MELEIKLECRIELVIIKLDLPSWSYDMQIDQVMGNIPFYSQDHYIGLTIMVILDKQIDQVMCNIPFYSQYSTLG